MKVTLRMVNGDEQEIESLPDADAMDLADDFQRGKDSVLVFTLAGEGSEMLYIARAHLVSIRLEE